MKNDKSYQYIDSAKGLQYDSYVEDIDMSKTHEKNNNNDYFVTEKRKIRFQLVVQYWHFVDILWIYLLAFLLLCQ